MSMEMLCMFFLLFIVEVIFLIYFIDFNRIIIGQLRFVVELLLKEKSKRSEIPRATLVPIGGDKFRLEDCFVQFDCGDGFWINDACRFKRESDALSEMNRMWQNNRINDCKKWSRIRVVQVCLIERAVVKED